MQPFIAFDVETPNCRNNRISAIGITVIQNGKITQSTGTLINPETHFDYFNMELTGITPEAVENAPTFPELWDSIKDVFENNVLLAHNAPFDMSVLSKCLTDYDLPHPDFLKYACTCNMARRFFPRMERRGLHDMCDYYNIPLNHHRADSDALACAELLLRYISEGRDVLPFIRTYDVNQKRTLRI
ncbi:MAG: 3'-5' exonuclease [Oscillospiraceae bacterium]|nr:3'-5' exonuclease [Oscillospiraceae bacterium]